MKSKLADFYEALCHTHAHTHTHTHTCTRWPSAPVSPCFYVCHLYVPSVCVPMCVCVFLFSRVRVSRHKVLRTCQPMSTQTYPPHVRRS